MRFAALLIIGIGLLLVVMAHRDTWSIVFNEIMSIGNPANTQTSSPPQPGFGPPCFGRPVLANGKCG